MMFEKFINKISKDFDVVKTEKNRYIISKNEKTVELDVIKHINYNNFIKFFNQLPKNEVARFYNYYNLDENDLFPICVGEKVDFSQIKRPYKGIFVGEGHSLFCNEGVDDESDLSSDVMDLIQREPILPHK